MTGQTPPRQPELFDSAAPVAGLLPTLRDRKSAGRPLPRERTALSIWFWEIDRVLLALIVVLIAIGLVAVAAASPVAAIDRSTSDVAVNPLHYFYRQVMWVAAGLPVMLFVSMLPRLEARRLAVLLTGVFAILLMLVPVIGTQVNGAARWIGSGMFRFQPSEFLKPAYVVTLAWMLSMRAKDRTLPVIPLSGLMTGLVAALLMKQPDFGQTVIFCGVWGVLLMLSGISWKAIGGLVGAGIALLVGVYFFYANGRDRINQFLGLNPDSAGGPTQVDLAHATITNGGLTGVGPGGGQAKFHLPEAHTDYIFSVVGEEFGLLACIAIALVYLAIVVRVLLRLLDEDDPFIILASAGLVSLMAMQAIINIGVNVQLFPSKG
ncbi:MAG TPA: FtsW/RodA/SpoVE family cell cycle protein, partial [Sphingobium sp.]|nr:FtsW/RodA/SpoVE family cell cycle protein [Sphingobium sp.]